jgi:hypothetical protein
MKKQLTKYLAIGFASLALLVPQAHALLIDGQIDMVGVAKFNSPLATATQVTQFYGTRAVIADGAFAAGGVVGDPLFGDLFSFVSQPWVFANAYAPLWTITGSGAPNTTFTFDLASASVTQSTGFIQILGQGTLSASGYEDTPFVWRFTSQGTLSSLNRFAFSATTEDPVVPGPQSVPDAGLTIGLLGIALMGVEGLRRKLAK